MAENGAARNVSMILVAHPSPTIAFGLVEILNQRGFRAVRSCGDCEPDLVVSTIDDNGASPTAGPVIAIVESEDAALYQDAYARGAVGVINLSQDDAAIAQVVRGALAGIPAVPLEVLREIVKNHRSAPPDVTVDPVELQILMMRSRGLPNSTIADEIGYSVHTVTNRLKALCTRWGVDNTAQAIALATRWGLID